MKRFLLAIFLTIAAFSYGFAENNNEVVTSFAHEPYYTNSFMKVKYRLYEVKLTDNITYVTIEVVPIRNMDALPCWTSKETCVVSGNAVLPLLGIYNHKEDTYRNCTREDNLHFSNAKARTPHFYTLAFSGRIPAGSTEFNLVDPAEPYDRGYSFNNRTIKNPKTSEPLTEVDFKNHIGRGEDMISGIYEEQGGDQEKLACVCIDGNYIIGYISSNNPKTWWFTGDFKAALKATAEAGAFDATWLKENKLFEDGTFVRFTGEEMIVYPSSRKEKPRLFVKTYPNSADIPSMWSGSGFALYDNYIATNYHVVDNAQTIYIYGIHGDHTKGYPAVVVAADMDNDLAILKIEGTVIPNESIPYAIRNSICEVGEKIYAIGYPRTDILGDNVKITDGIVNSKSGYKNDMSRYQISATLHQGNSGGPIFDNNGNVMGIAVAIITKGEARNVNYAVKASYLNNLAESAISKDILPKKNKITQLEWPDKFKQIKNFVYYIECSNIPISMSSSMSNNKESDAIVYEWPSVSQKSVPNLSVKYVAISKDKTVLTFVYNNADHTNHNISINKGAYITANGVQYKLVKAKGVGVHPETTGIGSSEGSITFELCFPPIPADTKFIDFAEPSIEDEWTGWVLKGIALK